MDDRVATEHDPQPSASPGPVTPLDRRIAARTAVEPRLRAAVHRSIVPIREAWDQVAPRGQVVLESGHLEAIERAAVSDIEPYYLLGYDQDRVAGIAYCYAMHLDLASIEKDVPADALAALRSWNPAFMNQRILECGVVSGLGEAVAALPGYRADMCREAARAFESIGREAGAEFILVRDIPYAGLSEYSGFLEAGYAPLLGFPIATLAVRWSSFGEYFDALKSGARKQIRRLIDPPPSGEIRLIHDFGPHAERLASLWRQTNLKASDYSHETLTPAYFREMASRLPTRSHVVAALSHETVVAFILCLVGDDEYFGVHCGFDYAACDDDNVYVRIHLAMLKDALERKVRSVNLGITTYDPKFRRGFEAAPTVYLVKHVANPRLTLALARGLQNAIKQPENAHRPFKDQDVAIRPDLNALAAGLPLTPAPPPSDVFAKAYGYDRTDSLKLAGIYAFFPPFESAQGPITRHRGREVVMLGSNAYLGLATHPRVVAAAKAAIDRYGAGCSGSPLLNGTLDIHLELAQALASFMQKDDAILCSTGYQTNLGVVAAIAGRDDVVIMDQLDHASLVDGARLAGAEIVRFRHNDMESLEHVLRSHPARGKFVVADSVFSMEGTIADLPTIVELARKYGARTMVDEAHAIGVLGQGGRGAAEQLGVLTDVDIVMGTFSKSFASVGGFVAGDAKVIDYLRHVARSHMFSASLPPSAVAAVRAALEVIKAEPDRRQRLLLNAAYLSRRLEALGYDAPYRQTAIVPVHCGSDAMALGAFKRLLDKGVFVNPVLYPAVAKGRELLRTSCMATHTEDMLDRASAVFAAARTPSFPRRASVRLRPAAAAPTLRVRPMVFLPVADRHSFSHFYTSGTRHVLLKVPGFTRLEIGQAVDCGISFGKEGLIVQSQGLVVSKSRSAQPGGPPGIAVELLPIEADRRDLLERLVEGGGVPSCGRHAWRYHADIEVECAADADPAATLEDISLEGAAVHSRWDLGLGSRVPLRFKAPRCAPVEVDAEVRWRRDGDDPTIGVRFVFSEAGERDRVRQLIGSIKSAIAETVN